VVLFEFSIDIRPPVRRAGNLTIFMC